MTHPASQPVNVAVVGLGFMGITHIKSYQQLPGARLVAVCDAFRQPVNGVLAGVSGNISSSDALDLGRDLRAYKQLEDLLQDDAVDLVDLCVPTPLHAPQAVAALQSGKHVLCEKPLARTSAIAREIVNAAKSAKGFFMPAMCMRFWPGWAGLKQLAEQNTYGKILTARFRRVSAPPGWSRDSYFKGGDSGGALLDLHIHDTDFVQFLFGRPQSVFSTGLSRFSGAIDHVVTQYKVASGATVYAEGSWLLTAGFNMSFTVMFERATVDFDSARGTEALRVDEEGQPTRVVKPEGGDGYVEELRHLITSIQSGQAPGVVTAQDGLSAVEICEADEQSVKTGRVVDL
ncbi:MAG: Gfo/Idh/MocA family oxidoreductase [Microbacteriaceae bacterium]|nr:Gfo/Idh/MocA family oxidoreductase [Microbacteriaceae bacterium]